MTLAALDTPAIEDARARLPDRGDVPEEALEALEPSEERVGFNQGASLVEGGDGPTDHSHYPQGEDVLRPSAEDTLEALADHSKVADIEDVADELDTSRDTVAKAMQLHGIEDPDGETEDATEDVIHLPLHGEVDLEHVRTPVWRDARVLEHLAVRCQYGVADIKTVLERERNDGRPGSQPRWTVGESDIEDALADIGLMDRDEPESATAENEDLRLGGASHDFSESGDSSPSGGLTVNTADFE